MIEKITVRVFLVCLVACAGMVLFSIWGNGHLPEVYFKTTATFFIVGFGSFLCWFVGMLYSLRGSFRDLRSIP